MRLIDADALVKELSDKYIVPVDEATRGVAAFMGMQTRQVINNAPTVEAEPIKHGKDISYTVTNEYCEFKCSICGATLGEAAYGTMDGAKFNYCPNCGARLDEVEE